MARKQISDYLFERIEEAGVDCTFGIPGDFILPLYAAQQKSGLRTVVMAHEPAVGYAADAYARVKGLGVALVTYGAGGLNMVNATALAYAEESPLLVISGGPETRFRSQRALLHHCVKSFATQNNVYAEVTSANAIIGDVSTAAQIIDHVFDTVLSCSRPGYLELPRDRVNAEIDVSGKGKHFAGYKFSNGGKYDYSDGTLEQQVSGKHMQQLIGLIYERITNARQPVILAGVEISRFGLLKSVCEISETLNIPVVSSIMGKSSFPESHPNFIGIYFGQFGAEEVQRFFEDCDCIIAVGTVLTEMETGGFTAKLPLEKLVLINSEEIALGQKSIKYDPVLGPAALQFKVLAQTLADGIISGAQSGKLKKFTVPVIAAEKNNARIDDNLSVAHIIATINKVVNDKLSIVCDVGDCLYAGLSIKTDCFIAPGYYSSMGFGVPAGIGVQLADRTKRPLVLVGDGGFQMTGTELATAVKEGLSPIIVIFNNASYAMLKFIDQERDYFKIPTWDYVGLARALGAAGYQAQTCRQFDSALRTALRENNTVVIDARIAPDDISPALRRLTELVGKNMRTVTAGSL